MIMQPGTPLMFKVQTLSLPSINATACTASAGVSGVASTGCSSSASSGYFVPMSTLARRQVASVSAMPSASASVSGSAAPSATAAPIAPPTGNSTTSYRNVRARLEDCTDPAQIAINPIPRLLVQPTDLTAAMDRNNITAWPGASQLACRVR